jgi:death-on-curing protein
MRLFLLDSGYDISVSQDEKYDFVMNIASGRIDFDSICNWIEEHLIEATGTNMRS